MADSGKGPKVDMPDELMAQLDEDTDAEKVEDSIDVDSVPEADADLAPAGDTEATTDPAVELEELNSRYLRLAADFDNFKKRALKERQDLHNYANENLIKELLVTVDNLERAVGHGRQKEGEPETLLQGVELTYRSLMQALEKQGLKAVEAVGVVFDPGVHEAIRQVPSDEHDAGTVVEVLQKGYLLKDRLLRAALVAVSSGNKSE